MELGYPRNLQELRQHLMDPLYKNSFFIMLTSASSAGFGFFFWMLAARLYPSSDVGIATALISSMGMLILLSKLGFDQSIIRFFPHRDKSSVLGTAVTVTTLFSLLLGIGFIATVEIWSPELTIVREIALLYILFLIANSVTAFIGASFVALRRAELYFFQSLLFGSRLLLLVPLVALGAIGIFSALGLSFVIALAVSVFLLFRSGVGLTWIDRGFLKASVNYSAGNYVAGLFATAPGLILPVLVLNILGAEQTAYYYIAYALVTILFLIPTAFTTSLFVEGCNGEQLKKSVMKSLLGIYALLLPAVVVLFVFGETLLGLIGQDYVEGLHLLRIFAVSSFFFSLAEVYISIKKVQDGIRSLILVSCVIFVLLLAFSYLFMGVFGLAGVGYAWVLTYALVGAGVISAMMRRYFWN
ncbi:MAG: polysaccharide biosynthesis protein [Methanomicrobiaceae archaeon]|uniref:Oligosaccharide repeat unit transporter n=1 Tax=hydrocarbon metagenome TaxID=938273 RepID=A0A0W8FJJ1_9ZZZZ|nr:polysaccharide biosynthesis protein [Methanomicrobiaceae archaeon]